MKNLICTTLTLLAGRHAQANELDQHITAQALPFRAARPEEVGQLVDEYEAYRMSWCVQDWLLTSGQSIERVSSPWCISDNHRFLAASVDQRPNKTVLVDQVRNVVVYTSLPFTEFERKFCGAMPKDFWGRVIPAHKLERALLELLRSGT